jgi:hypothetical protein
MMHGQKNIKTCSLLIRHEVKLQVNRSLITETNYVDFASVAHLSMYHKQPIVAICNSTWKFEQIITIFEIRLRLKFLYFYLWKSLLLSSLLHTASLVKWQEKMKRFLWLISWLIIFENFIILNGTILKYNNNYDDSQIEIG